MKHIISLNKNAKTWDNGLPLGNGRLGATILGNMGEETITLNEETIWYGKDHDRKNKNTKENMERFRQLVKNDKTSEAQFLARMAMCSTPRYMNPYQYAADLKVLFKDHYGKNAENREIYLDLDDAVAHNNYNRYEKYYKRTYFVSHKYNVFVMHVETDAKHELTVQTYLMRKPFDEYTGVESDSVVYNYGQCGPDGINYYSAVRLEAQGAEVKTIGDCAYTENADGITIYAAVSTDFGDNNYKKDVLNCLEEASKAGYEKILEEHLEEYHNLKNRVTFDINNCVENKHITGEQLAQIREDDSSNSDYLVILLFEYARYLMIASSYDCQLPANLQGIWNGSFMPSWQSEFTININLEMNYWMVEKLGLKECHEPLFRLIERMVEKGKKTASELYGCRGFVAHHNTGLWANTDPEGCLDASPYWVMGGAWLALHMYEHYLFTLDEEFLKKRAMPVMREAILFFEDYLDESDDGYLLTGPTVSPENTYYTEEGEKVCLSMGPTMDIMILRQLCKAYIKSCKITQVKTELKETEEILSKLPPTKISEDGRIQEWQKDYREVSKGHRHISHLYGLHPGNEITKETPKLFKAAAETLKVRLDNGGGQTGWSRAWAANFSARLGDGELLYDNIKQLLKSSIKDNLYDSHPPFQIDGNFGIANAITEGIIQSHAGYIDILPALPSVWKSGHLHGVGLRGGIKADIDWDESELSKIVIKSNHDAAVEIHYRDSVKIIQIDKDSTVVIKF